jgi:hypothetical protein
MTQGVQARSRAFSGSQGGVGDDDGLVALAEHLDLHLCARRRLVGVDIGDGEALADRGIFESASVFFFGRTVRASC